MTIVDLGGGWRRGRYHHCAYIPEGDGGMSSQFKGYLWLKLRPRMWKAVPMDGRAERVHHCGDLLYPHLLEIHQ